MDDIGSASKRWAVYSRNIIGNVLFLKYIRPFKAWGPYRELTVDDWESIIKVLKKYNAMLTVGITAHWVEKNGDHTVFHKKYPEQARIIKQATDDGLIEVANHGLTHCVDSHHLPLAFSSNRRYHREFWDWIPINIQIHHFEAAQNYLEKYFSKKIVTFIPPGNVVSEKLIKILPHYNIRYLSARLSPEAKEHIPTSLMYINSDDIEAFHDRELVVYSTDWLEDKIIKYIQKGYDVTSINS